MGCIPRFLLLGKHDSFNVIILKNLQHFKKKMLEAGSRLLFLSCGGRGSTIYSSKKLLFEKELVASLKIFPPQSAAGAAPPLDIGKHPLSLALSHQGRGEMSGQRGECWAKVGAWLNMFPPPTGGRNKEGGILY